jgi:hypothetical protein
MTTYRKGGDNRPQIGKGKKKVEKRKRYEEEVKEERGGKRGNRRGGERGRERWVGQFHEGTNRWEFEDLGKKGILRYQRKLGKIAKIKN